jgi:mannose-6-phosphate isomerase
MAQAIRDSTLESLLMYEEVRPGDVLAINPGTIHALGEGVLIYEIQQSSDTTYRLYDWGRMGLDGKPRALHIDKGTQVANMDSLPTIAHTGDNPSKIVEVVESPYFRTLLYQLNAANGTQVELDTEGRRFATLTCIDGEASINGEMTMKKGQSMFIPACLGKYTLFGSARVLASSQPRVKA